MEKIKGKIIIISGPTATGKSELAMKFAREFNGVIINADSMQIYKGLPILSAQPSEEDKNEIEHLLYSELEPDEVSSVSSWLNAAKECIEYCRKKNKMPILVGGTGMYISKLMEGLSPIPEIDPKNRKAAKDKLEEVGIEEFAKICERQDPEFFKKIENQDKQRLKRIYEVFLQTGNKISYYHSLPKIKLFDEDEFFHININLHKTTIQIKSSKRFVNMLNNLNVIKEVKDFFKTYPYVLENFDSYGISSTIGLSEIKDYIFGQITREEMVIKVANKTNQYSKRQQTWFFNQFSHFDLVLNGMSKLSVEEFDIKRLEFYI